MAQEREYSRASFFVSYKMSKCIDGFHYPYFYSSRSVSHSTHSHFQLQNQGLNYMVTMMNGHPSVLALLHFKPTNSSTMFTQMYQRGTRNSLEAIVFTKVFINQTIGHSPHDLVLMELEPLHSLDAVLCLHELWTLAVGVSSHHLQNEFDLR